MAYKKKNGDLDMRYNSSKKRKKWITIATILFLILIAFATL